MKFGWFQHYLLPGFIFQSAIVAGAYGSGQEIEEFFVSYGAIGGLLAMAISAVVLSAVLAVSFEFSRRFQLFDYRSFFKRLIGKGWIIYEILYAMMMLLIISVIGAAAGQITNDIIGVPPVVGTIVNISMIALLAFFGTSAIERFLTLWSFVLYTAYITLLVFSFTQHGGLISENFANGAAASGWLQSGVKYAGYNLALVPVLLFCIRHLSRPKHAIIAGVLGGPIAMLPALMLFLALIGQHETPAYQASEQLPITIVLNSLRNADFLFIVFPLVLFGTFIETGAAMVHGVNERIDHYFHERRNRSMPQSYRALVAVVILAASILLASTMGLNSLIAKGYGTITYGFLIIFVAPVLTWGVWLIMRNASSKTEPR